MTTAVLLVHSPLVGPTTMQPLGAALAAVGWSPSVPDLRDATSSPTEFARAAARSGPADVVIGHSGAGAVLPAIAADVGARATVFADAVVPAATQESSPSLAFLGFIDALPHDDDRLPPWHEWWPAGTLERLVPDDALRTAIVAEMHGVPRDFYRQAALLPDGWWRAPIAYLQLSPAYDEDRRRATDWGWPLSIIDGHHLDLVTRPELVAEHVVDLVDELIDEVAR